jgi:NRAMP (natural resistance-associated macrophage protein)-like metal ion transporter
MDEQPTGVAPAAGPPGPGAREAALAREPGRVRRLLRLFGPGIISGASDDDPATVGTCASVGAALGYATLWTMLVGIPLMAAAQYVSGKVGLVTGRGLAGVLRQHYSRWLLYPVVLALVIANTINAGADLGAIADAVHLLVPAAPAPALILPAAVAVLALQVWGNYRLIERTFKWLALALVGYVGAAVLARPDWRAVLVATFVPTVHWDRGFLEALVGISGTTFAPYLYFWQGYQEVEEKVAMGRHKLWQRRGTTDAELRYAAYDVTVGMVLSNVVTWSIILATGATLFRAGRHEIGTAAEAAEALRPLAGNAAGALLAIGLIGAGFLAVPVLTASAAYTLSEALGWRYGLDHNPGRAPQFYGVILASTLVATEMNYLGINPVAALYGTSVIYGFLAPPLLMILMLVSRNRAIMGPRVNGRGVTALGWVATVAAAAAAAGLAATWLWP